MIMKVDVIMCSCNGAEKFENGCEDDMNFACTVNCGLPNDYRMTKNSTLCNTPWDRGRACLDWESDLSSYHEGFKQVRVVSGLKPLVSNLSCERQTL